MNRNRLLAFITSCIAFLCLTACEEPALERTSSPLRVYPNPVIYSIGIMVDVGESVTYSLQVYNPKGDLLFEERSTGSNSYEINTPAKGTYHIRLEASSKVYNQTVVKL